MIPPLRKFSENSSVLGVRVIPYKYDLPTNYLNCNNATFDPAICPPPPVLCLIFIQAEEKRQSCLESISQHVCNIAELQRGFQPKSQIDWLELLSCFFYRQGANR